MSIKVLDTSTQRLIQSSIQIQSPVTVLKELLDNAIDAAASEIDIQLSNYGLDSITIIDNGCGISKTEIELLGTTRVTSKDADQKAAGFRGEALFVLSSISKLIIKSRPKQQNVGICFDVNSKSCDETAMGFGTMVECKDLFNTLPVRKLFFTEPANKRLLIKNATYLLQQYALAHHKISIKVIADDQVLFSTFNYEKTKEGAMKAIFGPDFEKNLGKFEVMTVKAQLRGYLSKPRGGIKAQNNPKLFITLNNKPIQNVTIHNCIKQVFKAFTSADQPIGYLNIQIPFGTFDFNVSADKLTVRLYHEEFVLQFIRENYQAKLKEWQQETLESLPSRLTQVSQSATPTLNLRSDGLKIFQPIYPSISISSSVSKIQGLVSERSQLQPVTLNQQPLVLRQVQCSSPKFTKEIEQRLLLPRQLDQNQLLTRIQVTQNSTSQVQKFGQQPSSQMDLKVKFAEFCQFKQDEVFVDLEDPKYSDSNTDVIVETKNVFGNLQFIGQYNASFLLCCHQYQQKEVYIIDQHSLDEAIHFERLCKDFFKNIKRQQLIIPQKLILNPTQHQQIENVDLKLVAKYGFSFTHENEQYFLTSRPVIDGQILDSQQFIKIVEHISDDCFSLPQIIKDILANRSCKSAVKLGDNLTQQTVNRLLIQASLCDHPFNCPHGRPSIQKVQFESFSQQ